MKGTKLLKCYLRGEGGADEGGDHPALLAVVTLQSLLRGLPRTAVAVAERRLLLLLLLLLFLLVDGAGRPAGAPLDRGGRVGRSRGRGGGRGSGRGLALILL